YTVSDTLLFLSNSEVPHVTRVGALLRMDGP
ncbi:MAG: hypothetical protein ACI8X5_001853, partial [Planctomycetota bacterium]